MAQERSGSILAVDFGNVLTRGVLIDVVDGVYRLVARGETRSTSGYPVNDVFVALRRVADQITAVTGRRLLSKDGKIITPEQQDRSGVDDFVATASIGRTLRTALVGLVSEVSIASALRAAAGTYVDIVETLSLDDKRSPEERLNALIASNPDMVFMTGGTEGGAKEPVLALARVVRLAVKLLGKKPTVVYAGNSLLIPDIKAIFEGETALFIAPNVRPSINDEELEAAQLQLALAFDEQQSKQSGFDELGMMSRLGVLPTAQSYNLLVSYLGQSMKGNVLAVDVGSAVSTLSTSVDGRVMTTIRTDIGLGHSAESLRATVGDEAVTRWLPFMTGSNQVRHYTLNKTFRPGTLPETVVAGYLEHALLRAGIETLLSSSRPGWSKNVAQSQGLMPHLDLIVAAGSALTATGNPGFNALLILDSVQPTGVARLQSDPYGLIAALGALAHLNPQAVVQVMDSDSLEQVGTAFNLSGLPAANRIAMKIRITMPDGEVVKHELQGGHLWVFPLGVGQSAKVDVRTARGVNIGGKRRVKVAAEGGSLGLVFDARGRPLPLGSQIRERAAQMPVWIAEMTGDPVHPADESWFTVPKEESAQAEEVVPAARRGRDEKRDKKEAAPRRDRFGRRSKAEAASSEKIEEMDILEEMDKEEDFQSELDNLRKK
jgi:uncharacterized protein (TIGR01319 family)